MVAFDPGPARELLVLLGQYSYGLLTGCVLVFFGAALYTWIADLRELRLVEPLDRIQNPATVGGRVAGGIVQKEHGLATGAELHALVHARQEAGGPQARAGAGQSSRAPPAAAASRCSTSWLGIRPVTARITSST